VRASLDEAGIPDGPDGLPFLLSPRFEYDAELNSYFRRPALIDAPWNTSAPAPGCRAQAWQARTISGQHRYGSHLTSRGLHE
jgi:hypothetical protein